MSSLACLCPCVRPRWAGAAEDGGRGRGKAARAWADVASAGRTSRTYQVVLGEYDRSELEGPEQVIPVNAGDCFVHPLWNSNCVACG